GLSLVAVGTSLPNIAVSLNAALNSSSGIVFGSFLGANIVTIALLVPVGIFFSKSLDIDKKVFENDLFFLVLATILVFYFSTDGVVSFSEAFVLVLLFLFYLSYLFKFKLEFAKFFQFKNYLKTFYDFSYFFLNLGVYKSFLKHGLNPQTYVGLISQETDAFMEKFLEKNENVERGKFLEQYKAEIFDRVVKNFYLFFLGTITVWLGSELTIKGAIAISEYFRISQGIIALSMISFGISLPELSVTVSSIKKGFSGIFFGNIIGSCIANALLVLGGAALVSPVVFVFEEFAFSFVLLILVTVSLMVSAYTQWKITVQEAVFLLFLYLVFIYYLASTL
ncbi:MAG: sodium:calcium antiporter, partial [Candidatus Diapherotrites archaeon]|nr:sodium:calcium antiporter [Candidatus Diapherotrites archaeon]